MAEETGKIYGFNEYQSSPNPEYFLEDGELLDFGKSSLEVLFTPGHAPGHVSLYSQKNSILISGDVIFRKSIGRTDLPGGDHNTLIKSIMKKILPLPDKTQVFCGHGIPTSIGFEKKNNPFLQKSV